MEKRKSWAEKIAEEKPSVNVPKDFSNVDQLIRNRTDLCFKVAGKDSTGRDAYYFVLIDKDKKAAFLKHKVGDTYNIEDYGRIIYSAYGAKVPADVRLWLKEKYGFDNLGPDNDDDDDAIDFSLADYLNDTDE